jgi:two-component system, chemotaxis family, sensor kinase CheA
MDELTREFLIESQEGLDRMERCLTELEERPQDTALLAEIFRAVHTIKGTTGFLGFTRLEKLAHSGENLLGILRDGKLSADRVVITGLLQLLDGLRAILKTIEAEATEGVGEDNAFIEQLDRLQTPAQAAAKRPARIMAGVQAKAKASSAPAKRTVAPSAPTPSAPAPTAVAASAPTASKVLESPRGSPPAAASPAPADADAARSRSQANGAAESTLRVDVALLNRMMNLVGELVLTRNQVLQATASDPSMTMLSRRLDMVTADLRESVMRAHAARLQHLLQNAAHRARCLPVSRPPRPPADGRPGDRARQEPA